MTNQIVRHKDIPRHSLISRHIVKVYKHKLRKENPNFENPNPDNYDTYYVFVDSKIVGQYLYHRQRQWIASIYILEEHRGKGYGHMICRNLKEFHTGCRFSCLIKNTSALKMYNRYFDEESRDDVRVFFTIRSRA